MEQRDKGFPKMIPNKNWSLSGLEELIKKLLTTQVLCGQCEVDHYPIRRTIEQQYLCCQFFDQRFQSTKIPGFVKKHFKQSPCSIILIFWQRFGQVFIFSVNFRH